MNKYNFDLRGAKSTLVPIIGINTLTRTHVKYESYWTCMFLVAGVGEGI